MDNPGCYSLATLTIGAAMPQSLLTPIIGLDGMTAVTLDFDFKVGSGSGTVSVIVATSFDNNVNLRHVARVDFTSLSAVKQCNLEGLLSKGITTYADLASEGVQDGVLGNSLAAIVTVTGSFTNSTLSVRASVR